MHLLSIIFIIYIVSLIISLIFLYQHWKENRPEEHSIKEFIRYNNEWAAMAISPALNTALAIVAILLWIEEIKLN